MGLRTKSKVEILSKGNPSEGHRDSEPTTREYIEASMKWIIHSGIKRRVFQISQSDNPSCRYPLSFLRSNPSSLPDTTAVLFQSLGNSQHDSTPLPQSEDVWTIDSRLVDSREVFGWVEYLLIEGVGTFP